MSTWIKRLPARDEAISIAFKIRDAKGREWGYRVFTDEASSRDSEGNMVRRTVYRASLTRAGKLYGAEAPAFTAPPAGGSATEVLGKIRKRIDGAYRRLARKDGWR